MRDASFKEYFLPVKASCTTDRWSLSGETFSSRKLYSRLLKSLIRIKHCSQCEMVNESVRTRFFHIRYLLQKQPLIVQQGTFGVVCNRSQGRFSVDFKLF